MTKTAVFTSLYTFWLARFLSQPLTSKKILRFIDIRPSDSVLDIGGGRGTLANLLRMATGAQFVVAEANMNELKKGRDRCSQVQFVHSRAEYLPFQDESFDHVLMVRLLNFVHSPELTIKEAARVLKPGGKLFIADTDNTNPITRYLWKSLKTMVIEKTADFSPEQIDAILTKYGFAPQRHTTSGLLISAIKLA
jgi:ubiquinone/menaquinone biosynthesis C-methylase UbiE